MNKAGSENPSLAVANQGEAESRGNGGPSFTLGPRDTLEGKLTYEGNLRVEGRAEGEFRVTGDIEVAHGATVRASLEASSVAVQGDVQGTVIARQKLTLSGSGQLTGDVQVGRLQVSDGASLNGNVRMGGFE